MTNQHARVTTLPAFYAPFVVFGFALGFILSVFVLNGDSYGRVNLFYLLIIFFLIPVLGAILSLGSLILNKPFNSAFFIAKLPQTFSSKYSAKLYLLHNTMSGKSGRYWLFIQSQTAALGYSFATTIAFCGLLVLTDINFVWRSTILSPNEFFSTLELIAYPWRFINSAQPTLELIKLTQDSRLDIVYDTPNYYGLWWPFVIAVQLFYGLVLRIGLLLIGLSLRKWYSNTSDAQNSHRFSHDIAKQRAQQNHHRTKETLQPTIEAPVTHSLPENYAVLNWSKLPKDAVLQLSPSVWLKDGPCIDDDALHIAKTTHYPILVLVKAWEPPLGELEDFLQLTQGLLYPVSHINLPNTSNGKTPHTDVPQQPMGEWLRLVKNHPDWQLYQPLEEHVDEQ